MIATDFAGRAAKWAVKSDTSSDPRVGKRWAVYLGHIRVEGNYTSRAAAKVAMDMVKNERRWQ